MELTEGLQELLRADCEKIGDEKICQVYQKCFRSTWETTLSMEEDGSTFVITGDIGAMWLRDSSMQVLPYFRAVSDETVERALRGLIRKQAELILTDAYANAFNKKGDFSCYSRDKTKMGAFIWERKYEVDSLAFPILLLAEYIAATGRQDIFTERVLAALKRILEVWETEQHHESSSYTFERDSELETETLQNQGRGTPVSYTGMTWSGFRPSDDACRYHYILPANMLAVSALRRLCKLSVGKETACRAEKLAEEIAEGIYRYGIVRHPAYGEIFAYETDGMGHYNLMDDANVPSLLAAPWFGFCEKEDGIYRNTRRFVLSESNPYYYKGRAAEGVGSPHTPKGYVWHIAVAIRGLTAQSRKEQKEMLDMLVSTTAGTGYMHEGVDADEPQRYTRPWFAWANSMFCLLVKAYFHL